MTSLSAARPPLSPVFRLRQPPLILSRHIFFTTFLRHKPLFSATFQPFRLRPFLRRILSFIIAGCHFSASHHFHFNYWLRYFIILSGYYYHITGFGFQFFITGFMLIDAFSRFAADFQLRCHTPQPASAFRSSPLHTLAITAQPGRFQASIASPRFLRHFASW